MWHFNKLLNSVPLVLLYLNIQCDGHRVGRMKSDSVMSLSALLVVAWSSILKGVQCAEDVEKHLEMGNKMLAAGQLADALTHYHAAVDADPKNYKVFYRRATVYLAMGKSKAALPDLDKVIELKPDFTSARLQRANVKLKQGKLDEAHIDYEQVVQREPDNEEALLKLQEIEPLKINMNTAKELYDHQDYEGATEILSSLIDACPWDPHLRELRAECYIELGDYFKAIGDIRPTTKMRSDNTAGYYKLSMLNYKMGEAEESLTEIRECLKLDPDHKECFPHYKKVKKLVKQLESIHKFTQEENWDKCVDKARQMLKTEPDVFNYVHRARGHICHCESKAGNVEAALKMCNEVLKSEEKNVEALCDRAEAYLLDDRFEEAIEDYHTAEGIAHDYRRVQEGLKRAQKLQKQASKRDYYKILGVRRNANKREITRAYRQLAIKWHPDKHPEGEEKKKAEKMFMDIASAKEVLTDPEKRQKFDNGEDPLDAEEQAQANNPFQHGFNPFGHSGFQFKFHFN